MSFRSRLTLAATVAVAVAVALASLIVFFVVRGQLRGQVDTALRSRAGEIAASALFAVPAPQLGANRYLLRVPHEGFGEPGNGTYLQAVLANGGIARTADAQVMLPVDAATRERAQGRGRDFFRDATVQKTHVRIYTKGVANGALQVMAPLTSVDHVLHRLSIILLLVALGGVGVAAIIGAIVSRTALAPVRRLTETSEEVTATRDLSRRIDTGHRRDELGRLATTLNTMLAALEDSLRAQRQLVADASHELRTPLTSLRTNVEVLAREDGMPAAERERLLADIVAQLEEMTALVGDVVELARDNVRELESEDVELALVVEGAVARARRNFPYLEFRTRLAPSLVHGVPSRLERAVSNLLDNAGKWSPAAGVVEVDLAAGCVTVRDHGPGVPEEDLPFIFDRFYRAQAARGMPGSGLGLAIVRQVAEAHGGEVTAERAPDGGMVFRLRLPLAAPDEHEPPAALPAAAAAPGGARALVSRFRT